ncbi:two-component regulator propeller domain-containing protein [uncultured Kriegella sp.]|uniref:ligand-binding sensor domain-containing protein n=1 Tax=uncultured Kriegella sp. TaxID=1798910 RepID=UPI0030D8877C|tara:strand:+ start:25573 stop:27828 length:2256 start_codon:yes stop_codon:yes gene_type:complete
MKIVCFLVSCFLFFSCNERTGEYKNDLATEFSVYSDTPFEQEYHEGFLVAENSSDANNVRAISVDSDANIWIATKDGIYQKKATDPGWRLIIDNVDQGPAYDVALDASGTVWMATWNAIYTHKSGEVVKMKGPKPPIAKIVCAEEGIYALGPHGIWLFTEGAWEKKNFDSARSIRAALSDNNEGLWIGTDVGLYHCSDNETTVYQKNGDLVSAYVKGLDYDDEGKLWVGSMGGIAIRNATEKIGEKLPQDGLPNAHINVVKKAPNGTIWVGTNYGITRFNPGEKEYSVRLSSRWLMNNEVRDIAFDNEGNAWIATAKGVSAIKKKQMTLKSKADFFYNKLIQRHVREPWIVGRSKLTVPGDSTTIVPEDDDNDGEYTAMYLAMESFRYAVTKSPEAKERAKKAFDFLHYLREVTEIDGFFARTIIPVSWEDSHDMNRTYTPRELAEEIVRNPRQKPVEKRWHISKDGKWKWKGDTSSDELCGHLFGYYCYYTLVADSKEKERVANHFSKIMDHLIANDFNLIGVDGKHTKWGVWSPQMLNHDPEWASEKALNSLELLSFLKFTYHITKNEKYQNEYLQLINEEGYLENAKLLHHTNPAWETYFDIYMALYVYPPLIKYEDDPQIQREYENHLNEWFEKNRKTKSPFVNFAYNYLSGGSDELDASIAFLKDAPLDLIDWHIDNGKREDLKVVRKPILEELQVALRPPSEYRTVRWDNNIYEAVTGNPSQEKEPVYWLLPYWMGRYQNLIETK